MSYNYSSQTSTNTYLPYASAFTPGATNGKSFTWIDARQSENKFLYSQSVNLSVDPNTASDFRQAFFSTYLGATFQLMGNRAFSRSRSCAWRIVPQFANYYQSNGGVTPPLSSGSINRNSFALEVMFDDPIMHHDTPFRSPMFTQASNTGTGTGTYYKYLTVSGQSMVRYSNTYTYNWNDDGSGGGPVGM